LGFDREEDIDTGKAVGELHVARRHDVEVDHEKRRLPARRPEELLDPGRRPDVRLRRHHGYGLDQNARRHGAALLSPGV
jgi:hypothetical protein